jgi:hypothetical protein
MARRPPPATTSRVARASKPATAAPTVGRLPPEPEPPRVVVLVTVGLVVVVGCSPTGATTRIVSSSALFASMARRAAADHGRRGELDGHGRLQRHDICG